MNTPMTAPMTQIERHGRYLEMLLLIAAVAVGLLTARVAFAQEGRNVAHYNLQNGVALKGFDPVSYFAEGGGKPTMGVTDFSLEHSGVIYYFATSANMKTFLRDPEKFEPTYGGWCAYAMARNSKVDIDPRLFTLSGRRLHFFVNRRAKAGFDADVPGEEKLADGFWKQISGESPRK